MRMATNLRWLMRHGATIPPQSLGFLPILALVALVGVLSGCINQPKDSQGEPLTFSKMAGVKEGAGEQPDITRNTGATLNYQRVQLPDGSYGMVLCNAQVIHVPQFIVDNYDADTILAWVKGLGYASGAFVNTATGLYFLGETTPENDINWNGRSSVTVDKTVRKAPLPAPVPDPN